MHKKCYALFIIICLCLVAVVGGCGSSNSSTKSLSSQAKEVDLMNGNNTKVIGKFSIVEIDSSKITDESLIEWYHFAKENVGDKGKKYNYAIILYKDKPNQGIMYNGILQKDTGLTKEKNGSYHFDSKGIILIEKDGKLVPFE